MPYMAKKEDGLAQSYFEYLGVPYTHSGVSFIMLWISKYPYVKRNKI